MNKGHVFLPADLNPYSDTKVRKTEYGGKKKGGQKPNLTFRDKRKFERGQQVIVDHLQGPYLAEFEKRTKSGRLTVRPVCEERADYGHQRRSVRPQNIIRKF